MRLLRPDVLLSDRLVPPLLVGLSEPRAGPPPPPPPPLADRWRWLAPRVPVSGALSFSELAMTSIHGERRLASRLGSCRLEASSAPRLTEATASLKLEELGVETADGTRLASLANLQVRSGGPLPDLFSVTGLLGCLCWQEYKVYYYCGFTNRNIMHIELVPETRPLEAINSIQDICVKPV